MSDLVERLRESAQYWINEIDTRKEAADEIESLTADLAEARAGNERLVKTGLALSAERDRLAADLAEARAEIQNLKQREAKCEELYQEARGLLRLWRRWYESPAATLEAEERGERISIDTDAFFSRTEGK